MNWDLFFPTFGLETRHWLSPGLRPGLAASGPSDAIGSPGSRARDSRTGLTHGLRWVSTLLTTDLGTRSLRNPVSRSPTTDLSRGPVSAETLTMHPIRPYPSIPCVSPVCRPLCSTRRVLLTSADPSNTSEHTDAHARPRAGAQTPPQAPTSGTNAQTGCRPTCPRTRTRPPGHTQTPARHPRVPAGRAVRTSRTPRAHARMGAPSRPEMGVRGQHARVPRRTPGRGKSPPPRPHTHACTPTCTHSWPRAIHGGE